MFYHEDRGHNKNHQDLARTIDNWIGVQIARFFPDNISVQVSPGAVLVLAVLHPTHIATIRSRVIHYEHKDVD